MAAVAAIAGVGMMVCCSSSVAALMMGGSEETPATATATTPTTPSVPDPKSEVFYVGGYDYTKAQAAATCTTHGAVVATGAQLAAAQVAKADWCATGWLSDQTVAKYPINTTIRPGCGGAPSVVEYTPPNGKAGVNCYGVKPVVDTEGISPFNTTKWSRYA